MSARNNMMDIHMHLIPGVEDGAQDENIAAKPMPLFGEMREGC